MYTVHIDEQDKINLKSKTPLSSDFPPSYQLLFFLEFLIPLEVLA